MKEYSSFIFTALPDWNRVPEGVLSEFCWEKCDAYHPDCRFKMCAVSGKGVYARLTAAEESPKAVFKNRDEPIYKDSCLEFFFCPSGRENGYINVEMNSIGTFLSEFGKERAGRQFVKELTELSPEVKVLKTECGWGVEVFLSNSLLGAITGDAFSISQGEYYGNFYKCGDCTAKPHYCACFPVGCAALGFHNPVCFGKIILKEDECQ